MDKIILTSNACPIVKMIININIEKVQTNNLDHKVFFKNNNNVIISH